MASSFNLFFNLCYFCFILGGFLIISHLQENSVRYTPDQITSKIISDMKYSDLIKVDYDQVSKHYDIPEGTISGCSVYMSKSSESASELACFLLADKSKYENLHKTIASHMNTKASGFKNLNPAQYNLIKNYLIVQKGKYVLVAIGNNTAAEEKSFQSILD